mgnify:CR=1 FL=1
MTLTDQSKPRVRHGLIEDWRDGVGILLLLMVAAFFGALITRFWPDGEEPTKLSTDLSARIAAIEARLAHERDPVSKLRERIIKLEGRVKATEAVLAIGGVAGDLAKIGANLAPSASAGVESVVGQLGTNPAQKGSEDFAKRLAALETKTATTPDDLKAAKESLGTLTATVTKVDERLAKLEQSDLLDLARRAALANAVANLTRASQSSSPFKTEYDVVAAMMPGDARIAEVAPAAASGLPTSGTLIATFGGAADAAIDAERLQESQDIWTRLGANFSALISARPVGEIAGNTTEARLARAEVRLKAGDLIAAVKEMRAIRGAAREKLKQWLASAAARVNLEKTLAEINTDAIKALAGPAAAHANDPVPQLPTP